MTINGELLNAALGYYKHGWPIIPMKGGRPAVPWRRFLLAKPSEETLRDRFSRPDVTGVAVGLAQWSGNLACRSFNSADAYNRWADAHADFAKRLPTVKTAAGRDIFFRSGLRDSKKFADGEYACTDYKHRMLPPSVCDGTLYEWFVEARGPLPLIEDPNEAGLLAPPQPEPIASNGVSVMQEAWKRAEAFAAKVENYHTDNLWRVPFDLAREVRNVADDRPERFRDAVRRFCEIVGWDFDDVWYSFLELFPKVIVPAGQDAFDVAAGAAVDKSGHPSLKLQKDYGDKADFVASLAYYLSGVKEDGVLFLPRDRVADWLGTRRLVTVSSIVGLLVQEGVLQILHNGAYSFKEHQSKEYKFVGSVRGRVICGRAPGEDVNHVIQPVT